MNFVPLEHRSGPVPCHYIPLNAAAETIESIRQKGDQEQLEEAVKNWLRSNIERLEGMTTGERPVPRTGWEENSLISTRPKCSSE
jgi:hypothetical protein